VKQFHKKKFNVTKTVTWWR